MSPRDPNELGALWEKTSSRGTYMTGQINGVGVVLFKNDRKEPGSKQPDWRVLKAKPKEEPPEEICSMCGSASDRCECVPF